MHVEDDKHRLAEQVNRWITTIQNSKTLPSLEGRQLESPDWWKPEFVDPIVERAIDGFRKSKRVLEELGDDLDSGAVDNSFVLPLKIIIQALPERYVQPDISPEELQRPIRIFLDDLFEQLARGVVRITVARLVFGVPVGLISSVALRDTETHVILPLKAVVDAIGPQVLGAHTAKPGKRRNTDYLPELFTIGPAAPKTVASEGTVHPAATPPAVEIAAAATVLPVPAATAAPSAPPATAVAEPVAPPPVVVAVATPAPVAATPEPVAPVAAVASAAPVVPASVFVSTAAFDRLNANGVDLNHATADEMLGLPGVSSALAREIVAYREQHGAFSDIFALADVPRVGRKTFRKISGMAYSRARRHRGAVLARWLNLPAEATANLPVLVRAIAARPGLRGCVMSDSDGLLLAESGAGDFAAVLSAIVPRLVGHVRDDIRDLGGDGVNSLTVSYGGQLITVVAGGDLYLTAIHAASRLTTGLHQFLRRVAVELAWWFSRRGYVTGEPKGAGAADHA